MKLITDNLAILQERLPVLALHRVPETADALDDCTEALAALVVELAPLLDLLEQHGDALLIIVDQLHRIATQIGSDR